MLCTRNGTWHNQPMTLPIIALVLLAALLHASWNALLKGGEDRFWSITIMGAATALSCAVLLPFFPLPHAASWTCILISALLHIGYNAFLVRAYRNGEFGAAYPVARGSSPMLVTLGAALVAHEAPGMKALAGILLTAVLFGLMHGAQYEWAWQQITLVSLAGAAFGFVRHRTGSTAASTILHGCFNLTQFVAFLTLRGYN